jgi:hypothetical protein
MTLDANEVRIRFDDVDEMPALEFVPVIDGDLEKLDLVLALARASIARQLALVRPLVAVVMGDADEIQRAQYGHHVDRRWRWRRLRRVELGLDAIKALQNGCK